jgi:hypothetical protein
MKSCITGKKAFITYELAEEALLEAHRRYQYGRTSGPVAVYHCEDCGNYHLTSQGVMNEKLARYLTEGKGKRDQEAYHWTEKMKKKGR